MSTGVIRARTRPHAVATEGHGRVLAPVQPLQLRVHVQVAFVAALGASLCSATLPSAAVAATASVQQIDSRM